MTNKKQDWHQKAIEHEATPRVLREMTDLEFLKKYNVPSSSYYYFLRKTETQKEIFKLSLNFAKRHTPEVLENLAERAKKDNKATELFLNYILKLKENLDITSGGDKIIPILGGKSHVHFNDSDQETVKTE